MSYFEMSLTAVLIQVLTEAGRFTIRWLRHKAKHYPELPPTGPNAYGPAQADPDRAPESTQAKK